MSSFLCHQVTNTTAYVPPLAKEPVHYNVDQWIEENEKYFLPPVCNKMMHNTQLKVFYVGGPNQRKDYHMEEGEEFFFMRKGDMTLKIVEQGKPKDVHIKEGQVFLLPARIPHSPQRQTNTVGLVIERERLSEERDGLRYFVEDGNKMDPTKILFQRWFHCKDLGKELGPIIKEYFASEQHKTGKPIDADLRANQSCWKEDEGRCTEKPFYLKDFLNSNREKICNNNEVDLFEQKLYKSDVKLLGCGQGPRTVLSDGGETFLWQLEGSSKISIGNREFRLIIDDVLLIPLDTSYQVNSSKDGITLSCKMSINNKFRA